MAADVGVCSVSSSAQTQLGRCFYKLRSLRAAEGENLRTELNLLFDQIISENYHATESSVRPEDVCALLVHASKLVQVRQEHLLIKLCQLIHHLLNRLQVIVDGQSLDLLLSYVTRALGTCSSWTHAEILQALAALVYGNGSRCQQHLPALLGPRGFLLHSIDASQPDVELRRSAVHCMTNLCLSAPGQLCLEEPYGSLCFRTFLHILQSCRPAGADDVTYCGLLQDALKGMQNLLSGWKGKLCVHEQLGSLLAVLKKYMFFGLPGINVDMPAVLYPAPLPQYDGFSTEKPEGQHESPSTNKVCKTKKRKSRNRGKKVDPDIRHEEEAEEECGTGAKAGLGKGEVMSCWRQGQGPITLPQMSAGRDPPGSLYPCWKRSSSDSEFSDPEGGLQSKLRLYQARVRQGALQFFLSLVKSVDKRLLYGYWSSFIPDSPTVGAPPPLTLLTIALKDPSPKVRAAALQVLSALLDGSRQFLSVAEDTGVVRHAYTPFSVTLAGSLRELHRGLLLALLAESSCQTLTQVLKCLATLVSNVSYNRLKPGLLAPLWKQIRPYLRHRDVNVRVSSLTLLGALISTQAPLPEVQLLLQQPAVGGLSSGGGTPQEHQPSWRSVSGEGLSDSCWLLQLCVSLVTRPCENSASDSDTGANASLEPAPVRLEALQVLAHLVRGYFPLVQTSLLELGDVSARCLREADASVQLHGAKLLEELGTGIIQQNRCESTVPPDSRAPMAQVVQFWSEVLSGPLTSALQNEQHPTLQTTACDTLSSILPQAFSQLPDKLQVMCITVLLGLTYSENTLVKAAAVRALGVYILFPCLREDVMFVADTANAILTALDDRSPNVRAKAAWSLGNLTDTLIVNMKSAGLDFQDEISDMLLLKMLMLAIQASGDKDRVKSNAVRALGNLLHFLQPARLSNAAFQMPLERALRALIGTVCSDTTMKVRWNACYALGNAFRNPALPLGSAPWTIDAYSALCEAVTTCRNFKVRIKSAAALSVPTRRCCYGDVWQFGAVWQALAEALQRSGEAEDFMEYRYCGSLRTQLCRALLHLLSLCRPADAHTLARTLQGELRHCLHNYMVRYLLDGEDGEGEGAAGVVEPQEKVRQLEDVLEVLQDTSEEQEDTQQAVLQLVTFVKDVLKSSRELQAS